MCGVLGVLPAIAIGQFRRALDSIAHRGPDDEGMKNISNEITLGHRRLSIIDLSAQGHQPMSDESGRYHIVFNGEIYNFIELKGELEGLGYSFRSSSDTEVVLAAYSLWGADCLRRFNGMWALAIWDNKEKTLFLARDRFGQKPLFYSQIGTHFIFASEMKAIYPFLPSLKASAAFNWCRDNIFLYEHTEQCLVEGIKRFPAGHYAHYTDGDLAITRYWNTLDSLVAVPKDYSDQVEKFRELFFSACKLRMRSDVKIGTALSGGLDSSATICGMAHLSKGQLDYGKQDWQHAFVASFPGTSLDETAYAQQVVEYIGIDATYVEIDPLRYWDQLEHYLYLFEELYLTSPIPMIMTYGAVKQHGVSVTLDGHGADEMLSGYGHLLTALWECKFDWRRAKDIIDTVHETSGEFAGQSTLSYLKTYGREIAKILLKSLCRLRQSQDGKHANFRHMDYFSQQLYVLFHETILPTLLRNYDRYSMINGVEIRMPFMDHRLVSYVFSLPYTSKFGGGYTKKLVRDAMNPFMPKAVTWRKSKIGFNSPIGDWMQGELHDWFGDLVHESAFLTSALVNNPHKTQQDILAIMSGKKQGFANAENAWSQLTPYLWEKAVLKRAIA